jgi:hypothetical protein
MRTLLPYGSACSPLRTEINIALGLGPKESVARDGIRSNPTSRAVDSELAMVCNGFTTVSTF